MAIGDTTKYSVWISTEPYDPSGNTFTHVCSDASISYGVRYGGSVTGMLGQSTGNAIFIDKSSGAIAKISISGVRANPTTSTDHIGINNTTKLTNAAFIDKLKKMVERTQMLANAYVLRIYNINCNGAVNYNTYKELYIFLKRASFSYSWTSISELNVSLECTRRNRGKGFGGQ